jgi:hypothetical protein
MVTHQAYGVRIGQTDSMSDNPPPPPQGARGIGRAIALLGWLLFAVAIGIIVLMAVLGSIRAGGVVLAILVAGSGLVALMLGSNIAHSRVSGRPSDRG